MPFIKKQSSGKFTVLPNSIFESGALDLKDIGMLCFILHLPPTWNFSVEGLVSVLKNNGRTSILSSLKSLEKAGYLARFQSRDKGSFREAIWVVSDTPMTNSDLLEVVSGVFGQDNSSLPSSENRTTGIRTQINTNRNNTLDISSNKDIKNNKHNNSIKENKTKQIKENAGFDVFWKAYPRKVGKETARKAFQKLDKDVSLDTLLRAIEAQKNTQQWRKDNGQFIPHPATWLNNRRWEDEVGPSEIQNGGGWDALTRMAMQELDGGNYEQTTDYPDAFDFESGVPNALPGHK